MSCHLPNLEFGIPSNKYLFLPRSTTIRNWCWCRLLSTTTSKTWWYSTPGWTVCDEQSRIFCNSRWLTFIRIRHDLPGLFASQVGGKDFWFRPSNGHLPASVSYVCGDLLSVSHQVCQSSDAPNSKDLDLLSGQPHGYVECKSWFLLRFALTYDMHTAKRCYHSAFSKVVAIYIYIYICSRS